MVNIEQILLDYPIAYPDKKNPEDADEDFLTSQCVMWSEGFQFNKLKPQLSLGIEFIRETMNDISREAFDVSMFNEVNKIVRENLRIAVRYSLVSLKNSTGKCITDDPEFSVSSVVEHSMWINAFSSFTKKDFVSFLNSSSATAYQKVCIAYPGIPMLNWFWKNGLICLKSSQKNEYFVCSYKYRTFNKVITVPDRDDDGTEVAK